MHTWSVFRSTWGGVGDVANLATCTHSRCSATHGVGCMRLPFLQLAHMVDVPQHMGWGGDVAVLAQGPTGRPQTQRLDRPDPDRPENQTRPEERRQDKTSSTSSSRGNSRSSSTNTCSSSSKSSIVAVVVTSTSLQ